MKRFNTLKTVELCIYLLLTIISLIVIFRDKDLYQMIGSNPHVMFISVMLWLAIGLAFVFMFLDYSSYQKLERENTELDVAVFNDPLTGIANKYRCDAYLSQFEGSFPRNMGSITFVITNLKETNEKLGHDAGDEEIRKFADILADEAKGICFVARNGGNKFLAVFGGNGETKKDAMANFLNKVGSRASGIEFSYGTSFDEGDDIFELIALSDVRAMIKG